MFNKYIVTPAFAALMISGCAIGPDFKKPEQPNLPQSFLGDIKNYKSEQNISNEWWKSYNDSNLNSYISIALENNLDLNSSKASIEAMMGQFDQAKSYLYPQISANGSMDKKGVKDAGSVYMLREGVTTINAANLSVASYEIDFFGKVRRANEAARAMLLSSQYAYDTLKLTTIAGVSASYFKLASLNEQIELAQRNIEINHEINNINKIKYEHGTIAETKYLQSKSELEGAKATLASLEALQASEQASLNTMLGRFNTKIKTTRLINIDNPEIPALLPSEILQKRPDIALSQQQLVAANAKIGVAKAAYFPSFKLTGLLGVQSSELSDLLSNPAKIWQIGPSISLPIFSAGRIAGEVKTAQAEYNQALAEYQKSVLSAINDTNSAIVDATKANEQQGYQKNSFEAIESALSQSILAYKVGQIEYSEMLLVQQQWLQAAQQYLTSMQNSLIASSFLYKSLGGGWSDSSENIEISYLPSGR